MIISNGVGKKMLLLLKNGIRTKTQETILYWPRVSASLRLVKKLTLPTTCIRNTLNSQTRLSKCIRKNTRTRKSTKSKRMIS